MSFVKTATARYEHVIVPMAVAAPVALETALFAKNVYQKPEKVEEKCRSIKQALINSVTKQPEESDEEFQQRLLYNTIRAIGSLALLGAIAYIPFVFFPLAVAIPLAISLIYFVGKLLADPARVPRYFQEKKVEVIDAFTQRENEADSDYRSRLGKNIAKTLGYTVLAAGVITLIAVGIPAIMSGIKADAIWTIPEFLPGQTPTVVFLEYALIGAIHAVMARNSYKKGDKADCAFHSFSALMSIVFPLWYLISPVQQMRLHHSFIGLALGLAPWRSVRMLGAFISIDSLLYAFSTVRVDAAGASYDFMNTIGNNFTLFLASMRAAAVIEDINKEVFEKEQEKTAEVKTLHALRRERGHLEKA